MFGSFAVPVHGVETTVSKTDSASVVSTQAIEVEGLPTWINERQMPEATSARVELAQSGVSYLLVDEQYRTRFDDHDYWFRSASKVTNRSGLESAGQISMTYNPIFERVSVNFIHLIRDGKIIDLTKEVQFRIVEREDELDDGIVSGRLKAITNLKDVRVGDIVDYATTVHTRTTLWPGQAFYHFSQRYSEPVAMRAVRFLWLEGMEPQTKSINSEVSFSTQKIAEGTEWEWITKDPPVIQGENDVPATAFQWGRIDVSTMKDWAALARWATGLYEGDDSLPEDFVARLDAISKISSAPGDRLTEATRYVQDNIRYVGEEMGEGSYVPRRPKTVLARAYGDCKDKSLLLAVALRRLGIDAVPALVSTREGNGLPDRLPSPLIFDHVIVRAMVDGKAIWIDPTGAHKGGRGSAMVPSNLGYALPIRSGQTTLEKMDGFGPYAGRVAVLEQFLVDETADIPLTLHVETRYTQARADNMRSSWAAGSAKSISDANLKFYRDRFPGIVESKPLERNDDRDANVLTMVENYTMSREAFSDAKISTKLITRAYAMQDVLPNRQANPRVQPLALSPYLVNEHKIELRVKDRLLDGLDDLTIDSGPVAFSRQTSKLPDGLLMTYRLNTGSRESVPASEAGKIYAVSDQIKDETGIEFYLEKSARASSTPQGIDAASWAPIKFEMKKIVALTQKNDEASRIEALSMLGSVADKVPHPSPVAGLIDGLKGAVLSDLRRPQAALAALQSATTQYDGNAEVFRLWIAHELDLGTAESLAKAMQRTREVQPNILATLNKQWVRIAMQKVQMLPPEKRENARGDLCIALADGGWEQDPRTIFGNTMLGCAIAAHSSRGEIAQARDKLAKYPPTDSLLTLAMDRRHQALWPEIDRLRNDGFRKNLEYEASRAAAAAKAAPKDYAAATYHMQTLRALGRFQDALSVGKDLAADKAQIEVVGSDAFWLVNEYASNLRALGRMDDAIAALDGVLSLGEDRYPELSSLAINRAEMIVAQGRFEAGLDSLAKIEAKSLSHLSAYGKMFVWANKACALHVLGRDDEAKNAIVLLADKPSDNWSAATAAAACRNDTSSIAEMLIKRMQDSDTRTAALGLFITFDASESRTAIEMAMRKAMSTARSTPAVQAELAKFGRAIRYAGTAQGWSEF